MLDYSFQSISLLELDFMCYFDLGNIFTTRMYSNHSVADPNYLPCNNINRSKYQCKDQHSIHDLNKKGKMKLVKSLFYSKGSIFCT